MNTKIFGLLGILLIVSLIPLADAQVSLGIDAVQKSIEVMINLDGGVHVKHVVRSSNLPVDLKLINGTVSNISVMNEQGVEKLFSMTDKVLLQPSDDDLIIEYDLEDVLSEINNVWTWDFRYNQTTTTTFLNPQEIDLFFVNERPVYLDDKKGISCHGCQMILEYSIDEPKNIIDVNWENKEFFIEIATFTNIENFEFNQPTKEIRFNVNESNQFITTIIPLELLWGPYVVFLDDEKILFQDYKNNDTHVWINMRPDTAGEISIIGTTVVPEFPIIAPLAIGFLIIMMAPLIKKINLR